MGGQRGMYNRNTPDPQMPPQLSSSFLLFAPLKALGDQVSAHFFWRKRDNHHLSRTLYAGKAAFWLVRKSLIFDLIIQDMGFSISRSYFWWDVRNDNPGTELKIESARQQLSSLRLWTTNCQLITDRQGTVSTPVLHIATYARQDKIGQVKTVVFGHMGILIMDYPTSTEGILRLGGPVEWCSTYHPRSLGRPDYTRISVLQT